MADSGIRLVVVDDDEWVRNYVKQLLQTEGYTVNDCRSGEEALEQLQRYDYDLVVTDVRMAEIDGIELLKRAREIEDPPEVIVMSGYATIDSAVEAIKQGAFDYIVKPLEEDRVINAVRLGVERRGLKLENRALRRRMLSAYGDERFVAVSPAMRDTMSVVDVVGNTDTTVLIEGESGTGKEIVAKSIHRRSARAAGPFVPVNCGALPESLLESELFGYDKGAFTGAASAKVGLFESANGGTLLLDEIGEMPLSLQAALLRVLQEGEIRRLGSTRRVGIDVRILASTNRKLNEMVREGTFREDLYYRLRVVPIYVPPLRERPEDIIPLTLYFLGHYGRVLGKEFRGVDDDAVQLLMRHRWPGNVRELENLVHAIVALYPSGNLALHQIMAVARIEVDHPTASDQLYTNAAATPRVVDRITLSADRLEAERKAIITALNDHNGHQGRAAEALGISRTSLWRKMKKHAIAGQHG